ncbi:hypothetical protein Z042_07480 [Chania multitudinisentens RB-25]|uniref:Uncharacterized protein n=1 Tax=Chania multitudinisentens RB-25 TaxID=1441930 RepID=W0LAR3_9GAMM|nr:hypothetical protein [Chania multitudinisentens]AHG19474.1 hypothetical protein Z042_07480 [Chania multitudinisentens RB-25]
MNKKKLKVLATGMTKGLKTETALNAFSCMLTKPTVETTLNAELTSHPGHEKMGTVANFGQRTPSVSSSGVARSAAC